MPDQPRWIEKAKTTYNFHRSKLLVDKKWTINKTATALKRSYGSVCEDLMLAKWLKTHEKQLERFEYIHEALEFVRERKSQLEMEEL